jgi:molybdate transport system ATP-binding protein
MPRLRFACRHAHASGFTLDAEFCAGDGITALVGPSGCGKTTALNLIAGILRPAAGAIILNDRTLVDTARGIWTPPERRRIGMVFQDHLLFGHLSVERNLRYGMRRRPARSIDFDRVATILELTDVLRRAPHTLSGGQRQRVALGRALLRGPELLLMDEPLSALDVALKERIVEYLRRALAQWSIPTILVSHNEADVARLADSVVRMADGRIIDTAGT